jgi:hypothetical protein
MTTSYDYDVSANFPDGKVNTARLQDEIRASSIVTALERIDTAGGSLSQQNVLTGGSIYIVFKATLSAGDKTILDGDTTNPAGGLIAAHDNSPTISVGKTNLVNEDGTSVNFPSVDGTPIVNPDKVPQGHILYVTGAFDDIDGGVRGAGALFQVSRTDQGEASVEGRFLEYVYAVGGGLGSDGAAAGDWASYECYAPASAPEDRTGTHDGNANKVPTGLGFNIVVPAPLNDGDWNVDGATLEAGQINDGLVPVPNQSGTGFWNWDPNASPSITPVANPGAPDGAYDLYDVPIPLTRQANRIPLLGVQGDVVPDAVRPKMLLPHWKVKITVHRETTGTVTASAWLAFGRKNTL